MYEGKGEEEETVVQGICIMVVSAWYNYNNPIHICGTVLLCRLACFKKHHSISTEIGLYYGQ